MDNPRSPSARVRLEAAADLPTRFGELPRRRLLEQPRRQGAPRARPRRRVGAPTSSRCGSTRSASRATCSARCAAIAATSSALALRHIGERRGRSLLYLRQEGRGIGLTQQDPRLRAPGAAGLDTVDANLALGFRDDERDYGIAAFMLRTLGVRSVQLLTNNPDKIRQLAAHGIPAERVPDSIEPGPHNRAYLETKARRSGQSVL